jgi:hypothetical protein
MAARCRTCAWSPPAEVLCYLHRDDDRATLRSSPVTLHARSGTIRDRAEPAGIASEGCLISGPAGSRQQEAHQGQPAARPMRADYRCLGGAQTPCQTPRALAARREQLMADASVMAKPR